MAEPILAEENNRHTFFPIIHSDLYELYKKQLACFWVVDEIDMSKDKNNSDLDFWNFSETSSMEHSPKRKNHFLGFNKITDLSTLLSPSTENDKQESPVEIQTLYKYRMEFKNEFKEIK